MIFFRTDGNSSIGLGHIMRCLSIADIGKREGKECVFFLASFDFQKVIESHGHKVIVLDTDYKNLNAELDIVMPYLQIQNLTAFIVDSYFVTLYYLYALWDAVKLAGGRLVYIDDMVLFPYPCDILINYNIFGLDKKDRYENLYRNAGRKVPTLLLGTSYVPLREEFQNIPMRMVKKKATNILISTGGADTEHMTIELLKAAKAYTDKCIFHFIIGLMNKDRDAIEHFSKGETNIVLHENVEHMAELMTGCDAAVSAAGSTLYELCAVQVPAVTYILAENQVPGAEAFQDYGVLENAGDVREFGSAKLAERLINKVMKLAYSCEARKRIVCKMRAFVDGKGAERIMNRL